MLWTTTDTFLSFVASPGDACAVLGDPAASTQMQSCDLKGESLTSEVWEPGWEVLAPCLAARFHTSAELPLKRAILNF